MLFKYYIRIQASEGMCPANNVEFWLELQRYKVQHHMNDVFLFILCSLSILQEMFHSHMNQKLLQEKMRAIIYCYFQSPSPPHIQVRLSQRERQSPSMEIVWVRKIHIRYKYTFVGVVFNFLAVFSVLISLHDALSLFKIYNYIWIAASSQK